MVREFRAVLFDFDGVLVNSEPLHFYAFHEVLRQENIELTEQQYYGEMIGFDDRGAFVRAFELNNRPLEARVLLRVMALKSRVMMDLIRDRRYAALPGAAEFVRSLWREYPLGICSGALREEIEAMLEGISLRDCFRVIVSAEDVTRGKPDPQGYLLTARLLGEKIGRELAPAQCLVVEDAPTVIRRARKAGFPTLGVASTCAIEKLADADWAVESLDPPQVRAKVPGLRMMI